MLSQETNPNVKELHTLEIRALCAFRNHEKSNLTDTDLLLASGIRPGQFRRATEWLISKNLLEITDETPQVTVSLTDIGKDYLEKGVTPESALINRAQETTHLTLKELQKDTRFKQSEWGSAFGGLQKEGVVRLLGEAIQISDKINAAFYTNLLFPKLFQHLENTGDSANFDSLPKKIQSYVKLHTRKRGKGNTPFRIDEKVERTYQLTSDGLKTLKNLPKSNPTEKETSQLTSEMLKNSSWKNLSFRRYNLSIKPPRILIGRFHPYRSYLDQIRRKLLSLGFKEMVGGLVETEFWNMDALFMPQFHSARNIHDAYYIKSPSLSKTTEEPYSTRVAKIHTDGGNTGSRGWRYLFDPNRSRRLILRSQGTALSARTLASKPNIPGKYFGMARCFRYDDIDATHAADFIQVEGIVLGDSINFRNLLGLLKLFAFEVAHTEAVRFLPDYFPFTEPSVELQVKHPNLGWIELGGAGLFRPEVTRPLGISTPVIAWGLGVDRMAMVALEIDDIRNLFNTNLETVRNKR